jgi:putative membrane protein
MKRQPRFLAQFAGLAVLSVGAVMFAQESANRLSNPDSTFATKAAQGGMAEVQLGQLATQNASDPDVKSFGQRMIDDHTKANDQLKQIAARKGLTLPSNLDAKDRATYDRLSKLHGAEFDRAYIADMVRDHRADIAEFEKEAKGGSDADLKNFASSTLPTLRTHLDLAEKAEAKVKRQG